MLAREGRWEANLGGRWVEYQTPYEIGQFLIAIDPTASGILGYSVYLLPGTIGDGLPDKVWTCIKYGFIKLSPSNNRMVNLTIVRQALLEQLSKAPFEQFIALTGVLVMEDQFVGKDPAGALLLSRGRGWVESLIAEHSKIDEGLVSIEIHPTTLKNLYTGSSDASKAYMIDVVRMKTGLDLRKTYPTKVAEAIADAIALGDVGCDTLKEWAQWMKQDAFNNQWETA